LGGMKLCAREWKRVGGYGADVGRGVGFGGVDGKKKKRTVGCGFPCHQAMGGVMGSPG